MNNFTSLQVEHCPNKIKKLSKKLYFLVEKSTEMFNSIRSPLILIYNPKLKILKLC